MTRDNVGLLPLHNAIKHKCGESSILRILEANETAAAVPDTNSIPLLHHAIESELPESVILSLLTTNIEACQTHDNLGLLPLHKAIKHKFCDSTILRILEANEIAAQVPDTNGILPIQVAVESQMSDSVLLALLRANKDAFKVIKPSLMIPALGVQKGDTLDESVHTSGSKVNHMTKLAICQPQPAETIHGFLQDSIILNENNDTITYAETSESFSVLSMS